MNVLLARWLSRTDYGAFSVAWSFCLIFAAFHNAVILEPMTVVGPAEYGARMPKYLHTVGKLNWYVAVALGLAAMAVALFYREPTVRFTMLVLGVCLPGYLLLLTSRREQYVLNQPAKAFRISLVYACVLAALLAVCHAKGWLSAMTGMICIGVALPVALWSGTLQSSHLARRPASREELIEYGVGPVARAHWGYGKWLFASAILAVGIPDVQTILLSLLVDLKSAGALRAMMNFILPLSQLLTVLSVYFLPGLARKMKQAGAGVGLRQSIIFPVSMTVLSAGYVGVLVLAGPWLERLLYNGRMAQYVTYLPLLAAAALLSALGASFSTLLRAARNSQHQLVAGIVGTGVGVGAAFLLLKTHGISGAIWSMILANASTALVIIGTYLWMIRKKPGAWTALPE